MGATTFSVHSTGKTANEAFRAAQDYARYEHGHGGYTGTIAEKSGYRLFAMPPGVRCTPDKFIGLLDEVDEFESLSYLRSDLQYARNKTELRQREAQIRKEERRQASFWRKNAALKRVLLDAASVYHDKWGPAVAIEVTGTRAVAIKKAKGRAGTHDKVFLFCGWASC